ncbi:MAG: small integral membrane protein 12, partial [Muribaculaceae bacterium]|nr:small integral membrane protein 12 [Muribaculaceae bacterium]
DNNLTEATDPYDMSIGATLGQIYGELGQEDRLNDKKLIEKGQKVLWNLLERYAPYLAYNREMAISFGSPSLTRETRYAPYQFYRFVELYEQFGGDPNAVNELVEKYGVTRQELKRNYDILMGRAPANSTAGGDYVDATPDQPVDSATLAGYEEELAKYCEIANELASLSPEEYARSSQEERMIDSVLHQALEYYYSVGGSQERLKKYPNFNKLDQARSRKLNEDYIRNHPEFNM